MLLRTVDGATADITEADLQGLRSALRGQVLAPAQPGYEESRSLWNAMIDRRPGLVIRPLGVTDVIAAVRFVNERGLLLSMKGGGHNIAGLAVADGAVLLDHSLMRGVWVDPGRRVARAQAGCLLGDVDRETQLHGLAAVLGFVSQTGIAGLTLGGGFGYLSRRFGWTSDNVRAMDMVTADGRLVRASEAEHADLFWGLRGGGGNFGVVTGIEFDLHPVGAEIIGGAIAWRADQAPAVLAKVAEILAEGPPELAVACVMRPAPPAPWIAKDVHGQPVIVAVVCHSGTIEAGEQAVQPLKQIGAPVGDIVTRRTYASQQCLLDATQPRGRRYYWKSEYVTSFAPGLTAAASGHAAKIAGPHSAVVLFPLGAAIGRHANDHSAVGNRDARAVFNVTAQWEKADDDEAQMEWARSAWRDMKRFSTGGTYVNFLTEEESQDRTRAAYGANWERLAAIKAAWDPENRFRTNKNVAPRPA